MLQHLLDGTTVVTHSPLTSEVGSSNPELMWESWSLLTAGWQLTVQNLDQLMYWFPLSTKLPSRDMTCSVLKEK